ncbi:polysaccharide pyruvyl transferase family protein [Microlunatus sp. Y2014]|uniref:polysaccharide pyruvyl transferase family protein n=1 Tax=Microlunatus sp. Y2014 TaxID=3418488 RepID=UPI003DA77867
MTSAAPRVLLVSSWQTVNIGDVAHTPGALAAFAEFAPEAEVVLWAWRLGDRERELLTGHFDNVTVIDGGPSADLPDDLIDSCDVLVHGSAPFFVADREFASWRRRTSKPYGLFGVTFDPIAPFHMTLDQAVTMVDAIDGDLLAPGHREILDGASFVHCRDSLSLRFLQGQDIGADRLSFGPDATLAYEVGDEAGAEQIIGEYGLVPGEFLCVVPRVRFAPYHTMFGTPPTPDQVRKEAFNAGHTDADLAVLRQVVIDWVRDTGRDVLVVPEMAYVVELAAERMTDWPADVAPKVHVLPRFWSLAEASAVYARAAAVVSMDGHSPLLATAVGTPTRYLRLPTETVKGQMFADLGVGPALEIEPDPSRTIRTVLAAIVADPDGARAAVAGARTQGRAELQRMVTEVMESITGR